MTSSIPPVEPTFQETWGVGAALIWIPAASTGCIAMQACTYFHKFTHRDHYILRCMVAYIWFSCTALVLCEFWVMHGIIVEGYYLPSGLVTISLGFPIGIAMGITINCSVQGIYIFRMYKFNHNKYLLVCCCALEGIELGTGFAWGARVAHTVPAWQEAVLTEGLKGIIMTFFTTSMVLDTFIAVSTCYQLWRSRMIGFKRTRHLVDKLMRWTIQTGMLTSAMALVIVITENLDSYLWLTMIDFAPNCYVMGLLALLNARTSLSVELDTDDLDLVTTTNSLPVAHNSGLLRATMKS